MQKWKIINILNETNNHIIYNVSPIFDKNISSDDFNDLISTKWVLKFIKDNNIHEIEFINNLNIYEQFSFIRTPISKSYRYNIDKNNTWYTMERYDNSVSESVKFCQDNMILLGNYMINFFEYLHLIKRKVHGDIKAANILVNINKTKHFKIIDYESISDPDLNISCKNEGKDSYYYYCLGCESNKSFISFRMDLQAFGIILLNLAISNEKYKWLDWQIKALELYQKKYKCIINKYRYLNTMRKESFANIYNLIKNKKHQKIIFKYFDIISKQEWNKYPNPLVYNELKELFKIKYYKFKNYRRNSI